MYEILNLTVLRILRRNRNLGVLFDEFSARGEHARGGQFEARAREQPRDHTAGARPDDGYPFPASFVADNDYALGRVVEYLSHSPWWPKMAILVTEDDAQGGVDHIDAHRTILMAISPYAKRNYVSHTNSSFPGLLKTVFRLLRLPPHFFRQFTVGDLAQRAAAFDDVRRHIAHPVALSVFRRC